MDAVLPHPGMLPSGSSIASPECSRRRVSLSIDNEVWPPESLAGSSWMPRCGLSRLSCSIDKPAFPSRPGAPNPRRAAEGIGRSGATRSHAQRAVAREHGEDGEHRTFPEVSTVAHSPVEDRVSAHPLRNVTSRNRCRTYCVGSVERCLPRYISSGCRPKHHLMRQRMPPRFHPAL